MVEFRSLTDLLIYIFYYAYSTRRETDFKNGTIFLENINKKYIGTYISLNPR